MRAAPRLNGMSRLTACLSNELEPVSKSRIRFEAKARADEKAPHTQRYVSVLKKACPPPAGLQRRNRARDGVLKPLLKNGMTRGSRNLPHHLKIPRSGHGGQMIVESMVAHPPVGRVVGHDQKAGLDVNQFAAVQVAQTCADGLEDRLLGGPEAEKRKRCSSFQQAPIVGPTDPGIHPLGHGAHAFQIDAHRPHGGNSGHVPGLVAQRPVDAGPGAGATVLLLIELQRRMPRTCGCLEDRLPGQGLKLPMPPASIAVSGGFGDR